LKNNEKGFDMTATSLGLIGYHSIQFYTHDIEQSIQWHEKTFGFCPIARSTPAWEKERGMRSVALSGSDGVVWIITQPLKDFSPAAHYLAKHPDGVGFLNFSVKNIKQTAEFLADRKAPFIYDIQKLSDDNNGIWYETAIATPLDGVSFRFIENNNYAFCAPGLEWINKEAKDLPNAIGLDLGIDHVTSNGRSMHGITEFYRHCLGFERYWGIEFHTANYSSDQSTGSGLESIVMWDPESGIKFATNQPLAPYFNNSQIQVYINDNGGSGVQHIAIGTPNIIKSVEKVKDIGAQFLEAHDKYYEQLPKRLEEMKIEKINEPMEEVKKNSILLDGADGKYLLQIFMKEQSTQFNNKKFGPFFYELIQREGDESFGEGNFKALFDSIEKEQITLSRQSTDVYIESLA